MKGREGWLLQGVPKLLKQAKKQYFRHQEGLLCFYDDDMAKEPRGTIVLLDVVQITTDPKAKGVFNIITHSDSWRLQAVGDDVDGVRQAWIQALEGWMDANRPGYRKLKKMGIAPSSPPAQQSPSASPPAIVSDPRLVKSAADVDELASKATKLDEWGFQKIKATALDYRRMELELKLAQQDTAGSEIQGEILQRVSTLEAERDAKRAQAAACEGEVFKLEEMRAAAAQEARRLFAEFLKQVRTMSTAVLKPGFDLVQGVYEALQQGDEPTVSRGEIFELLSRFDMILPPVETALQMSLALLTKNRSDVATRVAELEVENKELSEQIEELQAKKQRLTEWSTHMRDLSTKLESLREIFPSLSTLQKKEQVVAWLKTPQPEDEPILRALYQMQNVLGSECATDLENLKLILMEKLPPTPDLVLGDDGSIKYATVEVLFKLLVNGEGLAKHAEFDDAVLYGFPSFAEPMDLLERIVLCFCSSLPPNFQGSRERAERLMDKNRRRLLGIIRRWMLFHERDFREKNLLRFLLDFLITAELSGLGAEANKLREQIESNVFPDMPVMPPSVLPPDLAHFELLDLSPLEVARQLTRLDSALFEAIETRDFLEASWTSKNPNVASGVKAITKQFNRMSQWVASMILLEEDVSRRARIIGFFIQVAEECIGLSNFNGLLQVMGALSKTEIHRLSKTWELVAKEKVKLYEGHRELLNTNYTLLRQRYAAARPPCLPYLGTYLSDMIMINEQRTRIGEKINFRKLQLQEKSLAALLKRTEEGVKFALREVREIRSFIMDDSRLYATDEKLMARSQELEPRADGSLSRTSSTKLKKARSSKGPLSSGGGGGGGGADKSSTFRLETYQPFRQDTGKGRKASLYRNRSSGAVPGTVIVAGTASGSAISTIVSSASNSDEHPGLSRALTVGDLSYMGSGHSPTLKHRDSGSETEGSPFRGLRSSGPRSVSGTMHPIRMGKRGSKPGDSKVGSSEVASEESSDYDVEEHDSCE